MGQQAPPAARPEQAKLLFSGEALIKALKQIDGCLGVDAASWQSGKQSIVAWFENKDAVVDWYYSSVHQALIKNLVGDPDEAGEPLAHISDDEGPIMVLATLTLDRQSKGTGVRLPISQISIELFAPLPGGASVGGRLAPDAFRVPHMKSYDQEDRPAETSATTEQGQREGG
jgi:hypothetical protein